jgi:hypothetical protein
VCIIEAIRAWYYNIILEQEEKRASELKTSKEKSRNYHHFSPRGSRCPSNFRHVSFSKKQKKRKNSHMCRPSTPPVKSYKAAAISQPKTKSGRRTTPLTSLESGIHALGNRSCDEATVQTFAQELGPLHVCTIASSSAFKSACRCIHACPGIVI